MEKARLERQNEYEQIVDEVNSTPVRSIDLMSVSDINLNSLNSNKSTQQEKSIISFRQKYSEEEKQQARENLQKNIKALFFSAPRSISELLYVTHLFPYSSVQYPLLIL